ncbi:MAG: WXG100 family type VII secretion target [Lentisphaeraceae bacterium]|nr:WXG100 family type VII secretion target [Lentisphaeraceae bacterium]
MAHAIIDPDEVRGFASELKKFNDELSSRMMSLYMRHKNLSESWQDQEQQKFSEEFEKAMKNLKKFMEVSNVQAPILMRKADKIDEYLNQR